MTKIESLTIDEHAEQYIKLQAVVSAAKLDLEEKKEELVKLCRKNGDIPAGAEKSMRLEGDRYLITASFGTSSSVNDEIVERIQAQLVSDKQQRLFGDLFHEKTSYVVAPTAPGVLQKLSTKVRTLFAKVMTTKPKEPSLKVEAKKKGGKQ